MPCCLPCLFFPSTGLLLRFCYGPMAAGVWDEYSNGERFQGEYSKGDHRVHTVKPAPCIVWMVASPLSHCVGQLSHCVGDLRWLTLVILTLTL